MYILHCKIFFYKYIFIVLYKHIKNADSDTCQNRH